MIANGDATTAQYSNQVPHTAAGYATAVQQTVMQTIALANKYNVKYKFALPASASVHEFETWGQYVCAFNNWIKPKPESATCKEYSGLPLNPDAAGVSQVAPRQVDYVTQAIQAMQTAIQTANGTAPNPQFNAANFIGIDLYAFAPKTIWSPSPPVADYDSGNVFYGNSPQSVPMGSYTEVNVPYVYSSPGYPTFGTLADGKTADQNTVLGYLSTQQLGATTCGGVTCLPMQTCSGGACSWI